MLAPGIAFPVRLVSLLPSATEIIAALGLTPFLVGRSHECDYPPEIKALPVCTRARLDAKQSSLAIEQAVQSLLRLALGIYDLELATLQRLQPTHIITQDQCDVCAVTLGDVQRAIAELFDPPPQLISLQPHSLADVWQDIRRVAVALGVSADPLLDSLHTRIQACQAWVSDRPRRQVVTIEWIDPLMTSGNWVPELIALAGGENILGTAGKHASYIEWSTLLASDPEVIIVMPCGFDLERTRQELHQAVQTYPQWQQLRALQSGQLYIVDGNAYFNRPGPRLVDSLEILVEILHPSQDLKFQGIGWQRYALSVAE
ncbi:cobalamin-binding protein [Thermosynechococcus sp. M55_K2018_012]|uniref:cobalamin-binding protein n=1 Tax=Thermosynechococcus sp. M55_K2018_012 TaxID=2747809 RepID=UPI001A087D00|nr:cobalamin-binding protein [Thermosynechococcus sp. M98_K2018_005]HIK48771.1 cobalamin-binding protein [Thermosynechococcus sp. M55_K2018_012]